MYSNILIPVVLDDGAKTDIALAAARALADEGARFTLLHVIEAIPVYVADYIPTDYISQARETMQEKLKELSASLPGSHTAIAEGHAGSRILQWAEDNGSDLIVVASHQPVFADILLGSVAHHVVRHAKCAVHVIR